MASRLFHVTRQRWGATMKTGGAFTFLLGIYLAAFPVIAGNLFETFFSPELQFVDLISSMVMMKVGVILSIFGLAIVLLCNILALVRTRSSSKRSLPKVTASEG